MEGIETVKGTLETPKVSVEEKSTAIVPTAEKEDSSNNTQVYKYETVKAKVPRMPYNI